MSRDKALGLVVIVICIVVFVFYTYYALVAPAIGNVLALPLIPHIWVLAIPIWLAITIILLIGAWIGWTLLTTPAPEPIEALEETEASAEEETGEEKTEGE
ncbi:MAG: hypothetical protein ACE5GD_05230 [Candidatus Geothermarchaeales archaeon]